MNADAHQRAIVWRTPSPPFNPLKDKGYRPERLLRRSSPRNRSATLVPQRRTDDTWLPFANAVPLRSTGSPQGLYPLTKTFGSHADASARARDQERVIDPAEPPTNSRELKSYTASNRLERCEREITARKHRADQARSKLRVIRAHHISEAALQPPSIQKGLKR